MTFGEVGELGTTTAQNIADRLILNYGAYGLSTYSEFFVPLIWRALEILRGEGEINIPEVPAHYLGFSRDDRVLNDHARELANVPGWGFYALVVLSTYHQRIPDNSNSFGSTWVEDQSAIYTIEDDDVTVPDADGADDGIPNRILATC